MLQIKWHLYCGVGSASDADCVERVYYLLGVAADIDYLHEKDFAQSHVRISLVRPTADAEVKTVKAVRVEFYAQFERQSLFRCLRDAVHELPRRLSDDCQTVKPFAQVKLFGQQADAVIFDRVQVADLYRLAVDARRKVAYVRSCEVATLEHGVESQKQEILQCTQKIAELRR